MNPRRRLMFKRRDRDKRLAAIAAAANGSAPEQSAPEQPSPEPVVKPLRKATPAPAPTVEEIQSVVSDEVVDKPVVDPKRTITKKPMVKKAPKKSVRKRKA